MLTLLGHSAETVFRLKQQLQALQSIISKNQRSESSHFNITALDATFCYFVDDDAPLSVDEESVVSRLLDGQLMPTQNFVLNHLSCSDDQVAILTVPRLGTISPWSSKATDIVHCCGLSKIRRVERGVLFKLKTSAPLMEDTLKKCVAALHDALTESWIASAEQLSTLFDAQPPKPLVEVDILSGGVDALSEANTKMGLALSEVEIQYLLDSYNNLGRNPTDVELMMFAQVNSEHCRHKIFNAKWKIDGAPDQRSLFSMIRNTHEKNGDAVKVAYHDNAAVLEGIEAPQFWSDVKTQTYQTQQESLGIVFKVETHNHPTAISPFPGAATGSGGEIRDEAATGRGGKPRAGLCGISVSHLRIPELRQPWESAEDKPDNIASPLDIMLEAPIGAASFNNEYGRPNLCGYFRNYEMEVSPWVRRGYHKPIMIAGGIGEIREAATYKKALTPDVLIIVLGGPGLPIGLGGGAASSRQTGTNEAALDFASVQRSNPEMERRAQEVIDACWRLGDENPIISIHDVGAGGLSNALPELVEADDLGAAFELRDVLSDASSMSPLEVWCNESQERFVLAIDSASLDVFTAMSEREHCPFSVVGRAKHKPELTVHDKHFDNDPVDLPMSVLFEKIPIPERTIETLTGQSQSKTENVKSFVLDLDEAIRGVMQFPAVADKSFLITIGDRSVSGLVARDQMVGPWQVPVADVAVTMNGYEGKSGAAMAMGERAPIAALNAKAAANITVGEAITNIAAADIDKLGDIAFSANWMSAANEAGEGAALYEAVKTIGLELCPALGIPIPVGKDSLSMATKWQTEGNQHVVASPLSLVISAAAPVQDVRLTLTPQLQPLFDSSLWLIDLGEGHNRLGASVLSQAFDFDFTQPPDLNSPDLLIRFFTLIKACRQTQSITAYHDRSDGGAFAVLSEMAFAGHVGITINLSDFECEPLALLFNEELGAVVQVPAEKNAAFQALLTEHQLDHCSSIIATLNEAESVIVKQNNAVLFESSRAELHQLWSSTSYHIQKLRDNPDCVDQEHANILAPNPNGLIEKINFTIPTYSNNRQTDTPKVAILREQGVNGHVEMAAAFYQAGFEAVDVHMNDLLSGQQNLEAFTGLAACGGFSFGDVLGAGRGWAMRILNNDKLATMFEQFFHRQNTFTLGVCNGCQMLSHVKSLIPGASHWPALTRNLSEQFEARFALVKLLPSQSLFFKGMEDSIIPVVVAHGEGRFDFENDAQLKTLQQNQQLAMQYVSPETLTPTDCYPYNPNGTLEGITALTSEDGRATILMPHPERVFRRLQMTWQSHQALSDEKAYSPWMQMFCNAYAFSMSSCNPIL